MHHFNETETQWTDRGPWAFHFAVHWYYEATCHKRIKVIRQFLRIKLLIEKLTTDDGRRRRTTDESALEKLRCLSAGGAKNMAVIQPALLLITHILYHCAKFGDARTSFNVIFDVCEFFPSLMFMMAEIILNISI